MRVKRAPRGSDTLSTKACLRGKAAAIAGASRGSSPAASPVASPPATPPAAPDRAELGEEGARRWGKQLGAILRMTDQDQGSKQLAIANHVIQLRFPDYSSTDIEKVLRWVHRPGMLAIWDRALAEAGVAPVNPSKAWRGVLPPPICKINGGRLHLELAKPLRAIAFRWSTGVDAVEAAYLYIVQREVLEPLMEVRAQEKNSCILGLLVSTGCCIRPGLGRYQS